MNQGKMVFSQIMEFAPYHVFKYCVQPYDGDFKVPDFTCWKQFPDRFELVFTLEHGRWLNMTAIELNVSNNYCLGRRIVSLTNSG
jgi:hypothetical protein